MNRASLIIALRRGLVLAAVIGMLATAVAYRQPAAERASIGNGEPTAPRGGPPPARRLAIDAEGLDAAIRRSAGYLIDACGEDGRFRYRTYLHSDRQPPPDYNVLRHAGAIYALTMYQQRTADPRALAAIRRATTFLRERCVAAPEEHPELLVVWSDPSVTHRDKPREAKLGGTGLGLVALVQAEQVSPGLVPRADLQRLGEFLVWMQKSDGSFYSKYHPGQGRDDRWISLYYPGETALGLLMLDELDPQAKWRQAAARGIGYLARPEVDRDPPLADHWMLLACEPLLKQLPKQPGGPSRDRLMQHARRTCLSFVAAQSGQNSDPQRRGCFTDDGRTTPSSTRLEGLLAARLFLPEDDPARPAIEHAIHEGIRFLLRSQVLHGPHAGAIPRAIAPLSRQDARHSWFNREVNEVRIDYVQHALSALIQYERAYFAQSPARLSGPSR